MTFNNKIKWILGLLLIFVLIIATNLIDRNNFIRVQDSLTTIYNDRLVASDLIYKISESIHKKELAILSNDSTFFKEENETINSKLQDKVDVFGTTKLTFDEENFFNELKGNLEKLYKLEETYVNSEYKNKKEVLFKISKIKNDIDALFDIQLDEGTKQIQVGERALRTVELFTQIEIYVLIFIAILVQFIILYDPKEVNEE